MKFIGQHIFDFIARFRNDVYLEDISTGTIASGGNLGLDANNKIVKADTETGELSFNGSTANGLLTYGNASTIDVESTLTYNGSTGIMLLESSISTTPQIFISNTNTDATSGKLVFQKSAAGSDNDDVGVVAFNSQDDGGNVQSFAQIVGEIADASNNDEAGKVRIGILTDGSALQDAFIATGLGTGERVDINLGHGSTSTTTIAGDLQVVGGDILGPTDGDLNITSDGNIVINVDHDSDETNQTIKFKYDGSTDGFEFNPSRGSVSQFSTSSSTYPLIYLQNTGDNATGAGHLNFNKKRIDTSTQIGEDDDLIGKTIYTSYNDNGTPELITFAEVQGTIADASDSDEAGKYEVKVTTSNGTTSALQNALSAVGSPSDNDVDVAIGHGTSSTTTIKGTLTMGSTAFVNNSGVVQVATQGTIDHNSLANYEASEHIRWHNDVSASATIHTNNITDLHGAGVDGSDNQLLTDNGDGTVTSESNFTYTGSALAVQAVLSTFSHGTSSNLAITNTGDNDAGGILLLKNERNSGSTANSDGDILGMIQFDGHNDAGTPADRTYALIKATAPDVSSGAEEGQLSLQVSSHDGELQPGVKLFSGNAEDEVDVTIGNGSTSVTTVAGALESTGKITILGGNYLFLSDSDNSHSTRIAHSTGPTNRTFTLPDATGTAALQETLGWNGSQTRIKILHSDFIADDGGRPVMIDDTAAGAEKLYLKTHSTLTAYATIAIPTGFDATHVMIYGFGTPAVEVWEHSITDKAGASKGTGNVNTEIDIIDVTSSTTNYLFIQVAQGSSDEIYGGYVTIAAT